MRYYWQEFNVASLCEYLIITVTDLETDTLLEIYKNRYSRCPVTNTIHYNSYNDLGCFGKENASRVFHVKSEMGSDMPGGSAITTFTSLIELRPIKVIMAGIAFGFDEINQKIGTVLVSESIMSYDFKKIGTKIDGDFLQMDYQYRARQMNCPTKLIKLFKAVRQQRSPINTPYDIEFGLLISGQTLIDNREYRDHLKSYFNAAIGGEMEGAGLCAATDAYPVDWVIIKGICDWADGNKAIDKDSKQKKAAENSINLIFDALDTLI